MANPAAVVLGMAQRCTSGRSVQPASPSCSAVMASSSSRTKVGYSRSAGTLRAVTVVMSAVEGGFVLVARACNAAHVAGRADCCGDMRSMSPLSCTKALWLDQAAL